MANGKRASNKLSAVEGLPKDERARQGACSSHGKFLRSVMTTREKRAGNTEQQTRQRKKDLDRILAPRFLSARMK